MKIPRRKFLALVGGTLIAWPLTASAQQAAMPVVGFLNASSPESYTHLVRAFRQGLGEAGFVEGQNVTVEYHWGEDRNDKLQALAAELVHRKVAVIAANTPAALASKGLTPTIPIVFITSSDPVELGLVASLSRPGGNVTGNTTLGAELALKRLELLHEVVPTATRMALLIDPTTPAQTDPQSRDLQAAAGTLGLDLDVLHGSSERDFESVFATLRQLRAGALVIGSGPLFFNRRDQLATLALRHAVPTTHDNRAFPEAGGLMSYGGSLMDAYRLLGVYTGRILKGEKPADLPVLQPTKFELVVNLKTAKALGLTVPQTLLVAADELIE
jgi:putative ABC transport system substrate-binding protein